MVWRGCVVLCEEGRRREVGVWCEMVLHRDTQWAGSKGPMKAKEKDAHWAGSDRRIG